MIGLHRCAVCGGIIWWWHKHPVQVTYLDEHHQLRRRHFHQEHRL